VDSLKRSSRSDGIAVPPKPSEYFKEEKLPQEKFPGEDALDTAVGAIKEYRARYALLPQ
jgi:hypothetical protein